jgi:UDP-GlcNAc:undecaprenyl-phosphate GlcNAc-1-phosphate transferase
VGVSIDFLTIPFYGLVQLPDFISLPVTILWLVGMANAINWIDGLDGLAAGVSGIAAIIMLVVSLFMNQPAAALIAAALAGGALGFLRYNFNPAKIFMGDGGSLLYGLYPGWGGGNWSGEDRDHGGGAVALPDSGGAHSRYVGGHS